MVDFKEFLSNGELRYKDFIGSVEYDETSDSFHGKILNIENLFIYEGKTYPELIEDFKRAVHEYKECQKVKAH